MIRRIQIASVICLGLLLILNGCSAKLRIDIDMYKGVPPDVMRKATDLVEIVQVQPVFTKEGREALKQQYLAEVKDVIVRGNSATYQLGGDSKKDAETKAQNDWSLLEPGFVAEWDLRIATPVKAVEDSLRLLLKSLLEESTSQSIRVRVETAALNQRYDAYVFGAGKFLERVESFLETSITALKARFEYARKEKARLELKAKKEPLTPEDVAKIENLVNAIKRVPDVKNSLTRSRNILISRAKELSVDRRAGIASKEAVAGRVVGYPIFTKDAALLDRRPTAWTPFVKEEFRARMGDAQFVVIREGLVVYRQKSLDFDPTPVAGAGAALTRVGLQVAAAVATGATGVPVAGLVPKDGGQQASETPVSQPQVVVNEAEMKDTQQLLQDRMLARREYLTRLAELMEKLAKPNINAETLTKIQKELERWTNFYHARARIPREVPQ